MFQHEIVINKVKEMRFSISSWLHILHASFKLCFQNLGLFAFQKLSSFIPVIHYHSIELFDFFQHEQALLFLYFYVCTRIMQIPYTDLVGVLFFCAQ